MLITEQIKGCEILAKDIYSDGGVVLISEGTILKKDYVEKLLELKITDVFVEDEISREIQVQDITEEKIRESAVRLFTTRYLLGLFDGSEFDAIPYSVVECKEHRALSQEAAEESIEKTES